MKRNKGFIHPKDKLHTYSDDYKNLGYDYNENLMRMNLSHVLFNNKFLATFIQGCVNIVMNNNIDGVKHIRTFYNIAVDKNYKKIN